MEQFARFVGFQTVAAGALMLAFPRAASRVIEVRHEFARLSPGALRLLGAWQLLTGLLLVWLTTRPSAEAVRLGEVIAPERRQAT